MRDLTFKTACRRLYELTYSGKLAIIVHARPDGDCIGSAYALSVLLSSVSCKSRIICADPLPKRLAFIAQMTSLPTVLTPTEIPDDYSPKQVNAVALDIAAPAQFGSLEGVYNVALSFDHHARSTPFCDRYLSPESSATGEIVWRIAREWVRMGYIKEIPSRMASAVYAAISSDTGCFRYSNVTPTTHRIAAQLVTIIPEHYDIDRLLFDTKTPGRLAAEQTALELLSLHDNGKISICSITLEEMEAKNLAGEDLDAFIDIARSVAGVEIAFSVRQEAEGAYRVSARSNSNADVSALCAAFGGGGHIKAAGCTICASSISEACEILISKAHSLIS